MCWQVLVKTYKIHPLLEVKWRGWRNAWELLTNCSLITPLSSVATIFTTSKYPHIHECGMQDVSYPNQESNWGKMIASSLVYKYYRTTKWRGKTNRPISQWNQQPRETHEEKWFLSESFSKMLELKTNSHVQSLIFVLVGMPCCFSPRAA